MQFFPTKAANRTWAKHLGGGVASIVTAMFSRLIRIVTTFAAVLAAYLAYSFAAVPFMEPSVKEREASVINFEGLPRAPAAETREAQLERWFPPDAWERDQPTIVETDQGALLIKGYEQRGDKGLKLEPVTIVLETSSSENGDTRYVLLQAPRGAMLNFDGPTNPAQGKFGRLEGGTLNGPVTIRSPDRQPGDEDYLHLQTGNVQMAPDRIVAPNEVKFRYGSSYGSGKDLIVSMEPAGDGKQPQFGKLKTLELVHVDNVHLQIDAPDELRRKDVSKPPSGAEAKADMDVTCDGPFTYDFQRRVASFKDQVKVSSPNPDGPPDQLTCDSLRIYFMERDEKGKSKGKADDLKSHNLSGLGIARIVAEGTPAVLRAPSYTAFARGEVLEFDLKNRRVRFKDGEKVILRYRHNAVEVPSFEYHFAEDDRLGQLRADGPGVIRGALPDDPSKTFEAVWQERLILQPDHGDHALSLVSGASVEYHGFGEFSADNLHVWLRESFRPSQGKEKPEVEYRPVSLLAERNVRVDSWHLSGNMQKAEVWISYTEEDASDAIAGTDDKRSGGILDSSPDAKRSARKFDIQSQGLQLQLLQNGQDAEVEHLVINGNVRLRETRTEDPNDIPLAIDAETVQVDHANTPRAQVRVQGKECKVSGRGLTITGDDIRLDRGKNQLWIPGSGTMTLPARKRRTIGLGTSRPTDTMASPMTVTWGGDMNFDGRMARFNRNIEVRGLQKSRDGEVFDLLVTGQDLDVVLTQRLDFSKEEHTEEVDVQRLAFQGAVSLQNYGSRGTRRISHDHMVVRDMTIDAASGDLHANGPGWGSSVRYERSLSERGLGRLNAGAEPNAAELVYIRVDFDDEIVGNTESRDVEFRGRVRSVYGPVEAWDETLELEPRGGPQKGQILMTSERLSLVEMGTHADTTERAVELVANENVTIEGKNFAATGWRMKYAKAKELLILEGDGRNDAELWRDGSMTPTAAAQRIFFWTDTYRYKWEGGRELNLLP